MSYIGTWYNTRRIQREFGCLDPDECENAWHQRSDVTEPAIAGPAPTGGR